MASLETDPFSSTNPIASSENNSFSTFPLPSSENDAYSNSAASSDELRSASPACMHKFRLYETRSVTALFFSTHSLHTLMSMSHHFVSISFSWIVLFLTFSYFSFLLDCAPCKYICTALYVFDMLIHEVVIRVVNWACPACRAIVFLLKKHTYIHVHLFSVV